MNRYDDWGPEAPFKGSMKILLAIVIYVVAAMLLVKFGQFLFSV